MKTGLHLNLHTRTSLCAVGMSLATLAQVFGQPVITQQPQNQTNLAGTTATFTVIATGTAPLSYQWRSYAASGTTFTNIWLATEPALLLANLRPTTRLFGVVVTDSVGLSTTSGPLATLTVLAPPSISSQPAIQIVTLGATATFSVTATGTEPFAYQWRFNDTNLAGETNRRLVLPNVQVIHAGNYTVLVTNNFGSVTSGSAGLTFPRIHRLEEITKNPDRTVSLRLAGVVPGIFVPYYDLYQLEVSTNLMDWSSLAMLQRTNDSLEPLTYLDSEARTLDQRFYRTHTNFFITPFPEPSGPYPVGIVSRLMTDPSRIRNTRPRNSSFMVTFWYPAQARPGVLPAAYVDKKITLVPDSTGNSSYWRSPTTVSEFRSHALPDVLLATNQASFPVVIYSHGHADHRQNNVDKAEELASHGYVVVAMEHEDAFASIFPDGQVIVIAPHGCPLVEDSYALIVAERIKDCRFLVDELSGLNATDALFAGRLDLEQLGAMGYSFGGVTVAEFARIDSRCKAVVLLDAGFTLVLSTNLTQLGLQKPFLAMSSTKDRPSCPGWPSWLPSSLALFAKATDHAFWCQIQDSTHVSFSDKGTMINNPEVTGNPTLASKRQGLAIRACALSFFNKYLKNQDDHFLDDPAAVYSNIINFQKK